MMNFNQFVETLKNDVAECLPISISKCGMNDGIALKENGVEFRSLTLNMEGISPVIYLEDYYNSYKQGEPLERIVKKIADSFVEALQVADTSQKERLLDNAERNIIPIVINTEKNSEILQSCPHIEMEDLSIIFRIMSVNDNKEISSVIVNNELFKSKLNFNSIEDMYEISMKNLNKNFPINMVNMGEMFGNEKCEDESMYILTNNYNTFGANAILNKDIFEELADKIDGELVILPSSIHELIVVKADKDIERLKSIVKEANETVVTDREFLSNNIYKYSRDDRTITVI